MWQPGDSIVERNLVNGKPWLGLPLIVVSDEPALLVAYLPERAAFGFPEGDWPTPDGRHPWSARGTWAGQGVLMLVRPDDPYAVWHFWEGEERRFTGWYVNLQEPFRRTSFGYDTQDLELDIWIPADGPWRWKDEHLVDQRVREGRFTTAQAEAARTEGRRVAAELDAGRRWWDQSWAEWTPDPEWPTPTFQPDWDESSADR